MEVPALALQGLTGHQSESRITAMPDGMPPPERPSSRGGRGRRNDIFAPKGRTVDSGALADVRGLLGARPRRSDLLIEHLHLLQDHYAHRSAPHLAALATE